MKELDVVYNLFVKDEDLMKANNANVAVVVFTCKPECSPIVYDITGLAEEDIVKAVKYMVWRLTEGCAYDYEIYKRIGNVFFAKLG